MRHQHPWLSSSRLRQLALAPIVNYIAPVSAVYAAPAPVIEFIAPAPGYMSPAPTGYAAPAPVDECNAAALAAHGAHADLFPAAPVE